MRDFYQLDVKALWKYFWSERASFWMICGYLFIEYVRPQSLYPALNILPWAQVFLGLALVTALADRSVKWVHDPANKWMILYGICIITSSALAFFPQVSTAHFIDFFQWFFIYFLIINIVNTKQRFYIFLLIFLLASFKISLSLARVWAMRGFSFTKWGLMGPPGYFENSGELAIQMLMFLPLAYYILQAIKVHLSKFRVWIVTLMPITAAMTIMGASSRGAQIGLAYQIYHIFLKGRLSLKKIAMAVTVIALGYMVLPQEQKQRLANTGHDNTSEQRLLYWKHGLEMIKEYPLLGVGFFNFSPYYERHFPQDTIHGQAELPHNIFIQVATDAGVLGLFVYLGLLHQGFRSCADLRKRGVAAAEEDRALYLNLGQGFAGSLWGFIIAGQFVTVGYYPFMWINLSLTVALRNILNKELSPRSDMVTSLKK